MSNLHTAAFNVIKGTASRQALLLAVASFFAARDHAPVALATGVEMRLHGENGAPAYEEPALATAAGFEGGTWGAPSRRTGTLRSEPTGPASYDHTGRWDALNTRELAEWALRVEAAARA